MVSVGSSDSLVKFLMQEDEITALCRQNFSDQINQMHTMFSSLDTIPPSFLEQLALCRARASATLMRSCEARSCWERAQLIIRDWLTKDTLISLDDIITLNAVLSQNAKGSWRTGEIFTHLVRHPEPHHLIPIMEQFYAWIVENEHKDPLHAAFMFRYFVVSIHPFNDANGRTSQLLADYLLMRHGYLPQAFFTRMETLMVGNPNRKSYMTPRRAFQRFSTTVKNSYVLWEQSMLKAPGL